MKYRQLIRFALLPALMALVATACEDEINFEGPQAPDAKPGESVLYIEDNTGGTGYANMEFRNSGTIDFTVKLTNPRTSDVDVRFAYDPSGLDEYNAANETEFEAVPQSLVTLGNGGASHIAAGQTESAPLTVTMTSDGSLTYEKTYVIPLRISTSDTRGFESRGAVNGDVKLIFVHDNTNMPDCVKTVIGDDGEEKEAIKLFCCMEMGDSHPLNVLSYTLQNSGKCMFDALILFSGNINYNVEEQRAYFYANKDITYCLNHYDELLKPLKDRGIKIIMGIMGNHDRAGIANLMPETAERFAKEVHALCEAYDLDGVFWDDEYTAYQSAPGFYSYGSSTAWSYLAYQLWKLQPDKWQITYHYGNANYTYEYEGVQGGTYIDYAVPDYAWYFSNFERFYNGMPHNHWGSISVECTGRYWTNRTLLKRARDEDWGPVMMFAFTPERNTREMQEQTMRDIADVLYDDTMVVGQTYVKTW